MTRQLGILLQSRPIAERRGAIREAPDAEPLPPRLLVRTELEQLLSELVGCEEEIDFVWRQPQLGGKGEEVARDDFDGRLRSRLTRGGREAVGLRPIELGRCDGEDARLTPCREVPQKTRHQGLQRGGRVALMQLGELLAEGRDSPFLSKEQRGEELGLHAHRRVQPLPQKAVQQGACLLTAACPIGLQRPIVERGTR